MSANQGHVQLKGNNPRRPDPKKGTLSGDVRIVIDRLSDEQRDLLPPDDRYKIDDERRVLIEMEDVTFDLEYARIQTERSFSIESIEAKLAGVGLLLHYNEMDSRIEELVVREGREIEVSGLRGAGGESGAVKISQVQVEKKPDTDIAPPGTDVATNGPADSDLPVVELDPEKSEPQTESLDEYTAVFDDNVRVQQFEGEEQVGQLLADRLKILFDFGSKERQLAKRGRGKQRMVDDADTKDADTKDAETNGVKTVAPGDVADEEADSLLAANEPRADERVRLTWSGPLRVTSRHLAKPADPDRRRLHVEATGKTVEVQDKQRTAVCTKLVYEDETGLVELYGTPDQPASVEVAGGGSLSGLEVKVDRTTGKGFVQGPGHLRSSGSRGLFGQAGGNSAGGGLFGSAGGGGGSGGDVFEVKFGGDVNATFGNIPFESVDSESGETKTTTIQTLHRAHFTGGVVMRQGLERFESERVDIDFALNAQGELYPVRVHAFENVTVSQGKRYIKAAKELIADFISYEVPKPAFDLDQARSVAMSRGMNPDDLDWTKIEKDYTAKKKYRTGLRHIFADGAVSLRDASQELEIDCGRLRCQFTDDQAIDSGVVTPEPGRDAFVGLGEFSIAAPKDIEFSAVQQSAKVDGSGKMTFLTDRDFDGSELDTPTLVRIMWLERMAFEGLKNVANFSGKVHVSTDKSTYDCDQLRVDFVDAVKKPAVPFVAQVGPRRSKWWIFTPLVKSVTRTSGGRTQFKISGPSLDKDPIFVQATGHVVVVNRNFREGSRRLKSRVQMKGPSMAIDLRKEFVRIDGKGSMLIEDYKPPRKPGQGGGAAGESSGKSSDSAKRMTPFGSQSRDEPSQTYLGWASSMKYQYDVNIAQLDRDVQLVHRSGSKMKMAAEILGEREAATLRDGRIATLDAQSLVVQFIRTENDSKAGASRLSGNEVQSFNASGQVYFVDSGISAIAQQITFSRDDDTLQIIGTKDEPAQLFDERGQFRSQTGPRFEWNRRTNTVRAQNSYGRMN
ncbi:MAG: hypothetical protein GXP29_01255 [Planctomycetes bacterium]|nr:hypothetical protein [Planctomycetota bacterium]